MSRVHRLPFTHAHYRLFNEPAHLFGPLFRKSDGICWTVQCDPHEDGAADRVNVHKHGVYVPSVFGSLPAV